MTTNAEKIAVCLWCNGSGVVTRLYDTNGVMLSDLKERACSACAGTGRAAPKAYNLSVPWASCVQSRRWGVEMWEWVKR